MLFRRARVLIRLRVEQLRSLGREVQQAIEVIRQYSEELRLQREQAEREALARKPFSNDMFEWDEQMSQSPGSYVQQMEWLQRVRDWGRDQDYRWDAERARFVREPTQQDRERYEAEGRLLTYSLDALGKEVVDCSAEVAEAYVQAHPDDPQPEPGKWATI